MRRESSVLWPGSLPPCAGSRRSAGSWSPAICPRLRPEALQWLLASRRPGRWATMPRRSVDNHVEPLLGHYDRRCRTLFEEIRLAGALRIGLAARHEKVHTPLIPQEIGAAWDNINTPEELGGLVDGRGRGRETRGTGRIREPVSALSRSRFLFGKRDIQCRYGSRTPARQHVLFSSVRGPACTGTLSRIDPDFDPHFKIFHDLMPFKVQEILLVSSRL